MSNVKKKFTSYEVIAVIIGALLMGFLWRVRGTHGWGSSWGLLNAGFIFLLFIVSVTGVRKKLDFSYVTLSALSFMLTVPAWGTLLTQITGVLEYENMQTGVYESVFINSFSGVFLMLCMGFGLASIFGVMLGRGFSDKQWRLRDFIIIVAVFYAIEIIAKLGPAHWILNLVQPEAGEIFAQGLEKADIADGVFKAYLSHFDDISWAKKLDGGRNYYSSVEAIAAFFSAVGVLLATRFCVKDKVSAKTGAVVCGAFAFAITISDLFFFISNGGYRMQNIIELPETFYAWSLWEYFTGFIAGGIITLFVLKLSPEKDLPELAFQKVQGKPKDVLTFLLCFVGGIGLNIVRPVLERFDESDYQILATVVVAVITLVVCVVVCKRLGLYLEKIDFSVFSTILLLVMVLYVFNMYMFTGEANFPTIHSYHNIFVSISCVAITLWCILKLKNQINEKA